MTTDGTALSQPLRRDAAENRAKLINAAREVFSARGTDASLEAIAALAEVGIATLYRRFPTREDLLASIINEELDEYISALEHALLEPNAWTGFEYFLKRMFELQARHPGLCHAPFMHLPNATELEKGRSRMTRMTDELIQRAKEQGTLRSGITTQDVMLAGWGNAGVITNSGHAEPEAQQRYLQLILGAMRTT